MQSTDTPTAPPQEFPSETSAGLRWDRINAARAKIRRGDYDFDPETQGLPAGVCLVSMLRDVLDEASATGPKPSRRQTRG